MARASERLIQRFGGIRPMANKLEVPVTTVQGWKKRGAIPAARLNDLRAAAARHGIVLEEADLEAVRSDERTAEPGRGVSHHTVRGEAGPEPELAVEPEPVPEAAPEAKAEPVPEPVILSGTAPKIEPEPVPTDTPLPVAPILAPRNEPVAPFERPTDSVTPPLPAVGKSPRGESVELSPPSETKAPETKAPEAGTAAAPEAVSAPSAGLGPLPSSARIPLREAPRAAMAPLAAATSVGSLSRRMPPTAPSETGLLGPKPTIPTNKPTMPAKPATPGEAAGFMTTSGSGTTSGATSGPLARGAVRLSIAAAVVALLGAGIAVLGPFWLTPAPTAIPAGTERWASDLESRISRVALEQVEQKSDFQKQIGGLDTELANHRQNTVKLADRITALEQELPTLQRRLAAQGLGSPTLAVLLAATQLRGALATPNAFQNELTAFRLSGFNDPELQQALDQISSRAGGGIASESWLIGRFSTVSVNILRAATLGDPVGRLADAVLDALSDWLPPIYRLTGVSEGVGPRAIVDRTQAWMAAGDFTRAADQLGELTGLPAEVAAPWLAEARARIVADHVRELLGKHMLTLTQPGAPAK